MGGVWYVVTRCNIQEIPNMPTKEQINDFSRFAVEQLNSGGAALSMDELYDLWRRQNPDPDEYTENVAAVNAAIHDYKAGDRGRPAGELSRELRGNLNSSCHE
jgi:hypothetical protein